MERDKKEKLNRNKPAWINLKFMSIYSYHLIRENLYLGNIYRQSIYIDIFQK
jgi:hypothetical protein